MAFVAVVGCAVRRVSHSLEIPCNLFCPSVLPSGSQQPQPLRRWELRATGTPAVIKCGARNWLGASAPDRSWKLPAVNLHCHNDDGNTATSKDTPYPVIRLNAQLCVRSTAPGQSLRIPYGGMGRHRRKSHAFACTHSHSVGVLGVRTGEAARLKIS